MYSSLLVEDELIEEEDEEEVEVDYDDEEGLIGGRFISALFGPLGASCSRLIVACFSALMMDLFGPLFIVFLSKLILS